MPLRMHALRGEPFFRFARATEERSVGQPQPAHISGRTPRCFNTMNKDKYRLFLGRAVRESNIKRQTNRVGKTEEIQGTL